LKKTKCEIPEEPVPSCEGDCKKSKDMLEDQEKYVKN